MVLVNPTYMTINTGAETTQFPLFHVKSGFGSH